MAGRFNLDEAQVRTLRVLDSLGESLSIGELASSRNGGDFWNRIVELSEMGLVDCSGNEYLINSSGRDVLRGYSAPQ